MSINSIPFLICFFVFLTIYYSQRNASSQNWAIAIGSLLFYLHANAEMLPVLAISTLIFYFIGLLIEKKKRFVGPYLIYGIGIVILGIFKYFDFFFDSFNGVYEYIDEDIVEIPHFHLILALGLSFYTFRMMSYALDVYNGKTKACHDLSRFFTYVSFFPAVLSGPIERFSNFDSQLDIHRNVNFTQMRVGFQQIVWGMFKKMVIADTAEMSVELVWKSPETVWSPMLILAAFLYSIQIYCDFSGYSDMALGVSKMMGINLTPNFKYPYFARNIQEFWRRWHISLTSWFTDYVYIPLGGNRCCKARVYFNIIVVFALSGLWHGQNITYLYWGVYNGLLMVFFAIFGATKYKDTISKITPKSISQLILTFLLASFGWILFRSPSIDAFFLYCNGLVSPEQWMMEPVNIFVHQPRLFISLILLFFFEWKYRTEEFPFSKKLINPLFLAIFFWFVISQRGGSIDFIYYNF